VFTVPLPERRPLTVKLLSKVTHIICRSSLKVFTQPLHLYLRTTMSLKPKPRVLLTGEIDFAKAEWNALSDIAALEVLAVVDQTN